MNRDQDAESACQESLQRACREFRDAWIAGLRPRLEEYLRRFPAGLYDGAFSRLLLIELEMRQELGESFEAADYRERFADHAGLVDCIFDGFELAESTTAGVQAGDETATFVQRAGDRRANSTDRGKALHDPQAGQHAGLQLGSFKILDRLGGGGMGEVFRAHDGILDRIVAIKLLKPDLRNDDKTVQRLRQEAQLAARLTHANIVQVYCLGEAEGETYICMQYVHGESLADRLRKQGRLTSMQALGVLRQCLAGLASAHKAGIIHRDIKPGNILLEAESERVLLSDFGLAFSRAAQQRLTSEGVRPGTAAYMSPEQCKSSRIDHRSDLYSLGVTLYEMLSGRKPFERGPAAQVAYQHLHTPPPPLARSAPNVPEELAALTHQLLAKKPQDRFQSADEVLAALDAMGLDEACPADGALQLPRDRSPGTCSIDALQESNGDPTADTEKATAARGRPVKIAAAVAAGVALGYYLLLTLFPAPSTDIKPEAAPQPHLGPPATAFENSLGMRFILAPAGEFRMGSQMLTGELISRFNLAARDVQTEYPAHDVSISRPFYMGACEVTQGQFEAVTGVNPSFFSPKRDGAGGFSARSSSLLPVENVTWDDAVDFCEKLSNLPEEKRTGRVYRLPTEAEWEYACQLDGGGLFAFGDDAAELPQYAYVAENSGRRTHPVGDRLPTGPGLYDLHGNVAEWCHDRFAQEYYFESPKGDPPGPPAGLHRVIRGGSWSGGAATCRSTYRDHASATLGNSAIGFRVVLMVDSAMEAQP